jgi:hypothetical protein
MKILLFYVITVIRCALRQFGEQIDCYMPGVYGFEYARYGQSFEFLVQIL